MNDDQLHKALDGDGRAMASLIDSLTPVIHSRAATALLRSPQRNNREIREEVKDLIQDTFVFLFANDAKILRGWEATRGLSLKNYVGLVSSRRFAILLRTSKRNPYEDTPVIDQDLEALADQHHHLTPEAALDARDLWRRLLDRLSRLLSPQGRELLQLVVVEQRPVADVVNLTGLSATSVYAWRSRLLRACRRELRHIQSENGG